MKKPNIDRPVRTRVIMRDAATARWLRFTRPSEVVAARTLAEVVPGLHRVEEAVSRDGLYAAGFVSYEAAPAFDGSLVVHDDEAVQVVGQASRLSTGRLARGPGNAGETPPVAGETPAPLLWFGLYEAIEEVELPTAARGAEAGGPDWQASVGQAEFHQAMARIKALIRSGDTYQVNYTYRLRAPFAGNDWNLFLRLVAAQDPPYGAFLDTGEWAICSASPELFFCLDGARILCRPMKGTAARGRTQAEDLAQAQALQASEKERAENVMIVDMVRHDLGRIAQPGSVKVARLFEVEKYPTIWQMTSTVEAQTEAGLGEIFQALFPASSVTGAPKVRTMQIIADLEPLPRRLYTGAIGFFAPGRRAQFNVAIRTLLVNRQSGCAEYGVGSGITWDSDPEAEWQECRAKARILAPQSPAFSLLETMRWTPEEGYYLLERHLERLQDSALYFSFKLDLASLRLKLGQLAARLGPKPRKIRLLVTKEGGVRLEAKVLPTNLACANPLPRIPPLPFRRGEDRGEGSVPPPASGSPRAAKRPPGLPKAAGKPQRIALAHAPVDSSAPFLCHKTTNREVYDAARAACPGYDDVLLFNERGEVTESTIANVAVEIAGQLYTPPVTCGLLPGTLRAQLLQQDRLVERRIAVAELLKSPRVFLLNSVRGVYAVEVVTGQDD